MPSWHTPDIGSRTFSDIISAKKFSAPKNEGLSNFPPDYYIQETNRLRIKMKKLQDVPDNKDKLKIINGKLKFDGVIIDKKPSFV